MRGSGGSGGGAGAGSDDSCDNSEGGAGGGAEVSRAGRQHHASWSDHCMSGILAGCFKVELPVKQRNFSSTDSVSP